MGTMEQSKKELSWHSGVVLLLLSALLLSASFVMAQPTAPPPAKPALNPGPQAGSGMETVHIVVGHSLVINTPSRVKRVLTGNPDVIESVVTSPEELVVTAKKAGSSSLVLWGEDGRVRALDVYGDVDVSSLRGSLEQSFPGVNFDLQSEG